MSVFIIVIILVFILFQFVFGIWNIFKFYFAKRKIKIRNCIKSEENYKILVVIPCLNEQTIIIDTIRYFYKMIINDNNIELVIVTTEKEMLEKQNITTYDLVNDYLSKKHIKNIKLIHYPKTDGIMAD